MSRGRVGKAGGLKGQWPHYVVAGCMPWNRRVFHEVIEKLPGRWDFIESPEELNVKTIQSMHPRYIFFLHWSWKVPDKLVSAHECVCFHMTDVPYGRGGSPLQNLIVRGVRHSKLTALRMTSDIDSGPVYLKRNLCLEGCAEEIYIRATYLAAAMIEQIIRDQPKPTAQKGKGVIFRRRTGRESKIVRPKSLGMLYDFIRMLDAEGYPRAFIDHSGFHFEFSRAALHEGEIRADVTITCLEKTKS